MKARAKTSREAWMLDVSLPIEGGEFGLAFVFGLVFLLNLVPMFAPPTWVALSAISFTAPQTDSLSLAIVAASAATLGRVLLAKSARYVLRGRLLNGEARENIDEIKTRLESHRAASAGGMLLFAFSPLPSNHLFIAYGLTSLPLRLAAAPFFVGRTVSYSLWSAGAAAAGSRIQLDPAHVSWTVIGYFVLTQLLLLPALYLMVRIDWRVMFDERRLRLRARK